jgi:hypothetical protein
VNFGATLEFVRQHCRFESPANTAARRKVGHLHYSTKETAIATVVDCGYTTIDQAYPQADWSFQIKREAQSS